MTKLKYYFDYKSPYAYLAQESAWQLSEALGSDFEMLPYTLQIPKYLGKAELNEQGEDTVGTRNDHQWRRVKYSYMDCRREANRRGLTVRGPRKIFDSSVSHIGYFFVREQADPRAYHDAVFEQFWRRELDIESIDAVSSVKKSCGYNTSGFVDYLEGTGVERYQETLNEAEARGVFGVPSYLFADDELYWGLERLPRVRERLGLATDA